MSIELGHKIYDLLPRGSEELQAAIRERIEEAIATDRAQREHGTGDVTSIDGEWRGVCNMCDWAQPIPSGWRELLRQSRDNCLRNFGASTMGSWVYADLEELFSAAPQAQPAPEPERPAGVVIFPNDQFREAFRGLIDTGDKP